MNHIMLDIETLGTSSNAVITSIGATFFNPLTGDNGAQFYAVVNPQSCVDIGMSVDISTIMWWMRQDDEARKHLYGAEKSDRIEDVLKDFTHWIISNSDSPPKVWGNGCTFDNVILSNAYNKLGVIRPWKYNGDMDVRTIVEIGRTCGIDPKTHIQFGGVKHNALHDAIHQAKYVSAIWMHIAGGDK